MSRRVLVSAHAKVNLTLEVVGTREDGYHELASVFDPVASANVAAWMFARGSAGQWACR